jgi:hypothetical protein
MRSARSSKLYVVLQSSDHYGTTYNNSVRKSFLRRLDRKNNQNSAMRPFATFEDPFLRRGEARLKKFELITADLS